MTSHEEISHLADVPVTVEVELDRKIMSLRDVLELKTLRDQVGARGACEKAARAVLAAIAEKGLLESESRVQNRAG